MKGFLKMFRTAFVFCAVMMLLCSFAYPLALTGASQAVMKEKAGGSLIDREGNLTDNPEEAVGSVLLGQDFTEDYFFQGRVSAVHYNTYTEEQKESGEYGGVSSGSFNYGNSNPDLEARIKKDLDSFLASHPGVKAEDVPADLLTASGSGLDPHISPASAAVQIPQLAENTGLTEEQLEQFVADNTTGKVLGIFGEETVNVLGVNLDIAEALGLIGGVD